MKQRATEDDIRQFMAAVYPEAPELAMASFDERGVLRTATALIRAQRARIVELVREYQGAVEAAIRCVERAYAQDQTIDGVIAALRKLQETP